jgi:hypothetical protein
MKAWLPLLLLLLPAFVKAQESNSDTNVIEWSAGRKLAWNDFQGRVPAVAREAALSQCGFGYATNSVTKREVLQVKVSARFYRKESWSRADKQSIRLLQHEQRHFDLCELYARKLRQNTASNHYTGADMKKVDKLYDELMEELNHMQQRYDGETTHGLDTDKQNEWNEKIAKEMNELSAFSASAP